MDEVQPQFRRLRMRRVLDHRAGIDRGAVLGCRNIDVRDGVPGLLLEHRLRLPGDAGIGQALHQEQRRLTMMDVRQHGASVGDLGLVHRRRQRIPARLLQGGIDLARNPLECRIRHRQANARLAEIGKRDDMRRIVPRDHDRQRVGDIRHRGCGEHAALDELVDFLESGEIGVRLRSPRHVAGRDGAAGFDLLDQQTGRDGLPIKPALVVGMLTFEFGHQRGHGEEVVAADVEHQLRVRDVAMEIGEIIDLRHGELEAAVLRIVVLAMLPGREDVLAVMRCLGFAVPLHRIGGGGSTQAAAHGNADRGGGRESGAAKRDVHDAAHFT